MSKANKTNKVKTTTSDTAGEPGDWASVYYQSDLGTYGVVYGAFGGDVEEVLAHDLTAAKADALARNVNRALRAARLPDGRRNNRRGKAN